MLLNLSSERLAAYELCPRRQQWQSTYRTRISLMGALYRALDAGLRGDNPERAAENEYMGLASTGLDIVGHDVYAVTTHYSKLAGIVATALRSAWADPWVPVQPVTLPSGQTWHSACYTTGDGVTRRIVLVDRWSDDRKMQELSGWRTIGEGCALDRPIVLTAIAIGASQDKRRHGVWTRGYRHPRNNTFRLQRRATDEDFSYTWKKIWREDSEISMERWLTQMRADGSIQDSVHSVHVPVPKHRSIYLGAIERMAEEMAKQPEVPPMRLAGCHGFSPCPFLGVCPDDDPRKYGFLLKPEELHQ